MGRPTDEGGVAGGVLALGRVGGGLVRRRTGGGVTGVSNWGRTSLSPSHNSAVTPPAFFAL
jgi:hypothetical protein